MAHAPDAPWIGRVLDGAYRVDALLGEGGFGAVYRGQQLAVGRAVALKVIRPDRLADRALAATLTERFRREAEATSRLTHPHTVRLIDFGEEADGALYLVLELLVGRDLGAVIDAEAPLEPARVARIGRQICASLTEAHEAGVVHRDLKPSNVMLCRFAGADDFVKVMDFGIARLAGAGEASLRLTATGTTQGTPLYMAPEQAMARETGPATDLYAVGCILFELLTGEPVFREATPLAVSLAHVSRPAPALELPGAPAGLAAAWAALVGGLLQKDPARRPASAAEVAARLAELEAASAGLAAAARPGAPAEGAVDGTADTLARTPAAAAPAGLAATRLAPDPALVTDARDATPPARRGRARWLAAGAAAVALAAAAGWLVWGPATGPAAVDAASTGAGVAPAWTERVARSAKRRAARAARRAARDQATPAAPPEVATARLVISTEPEGANVFRAGPDGQVAICATPCAADVAAAGGPEVLTLRKPGYDALRLEVVLTAGAIVDRTLVLEARPDPGAGTAAPEAAPGAGTPARERPRRPAPEAATLPPFDESAPVGRPGPAPSLQDEPARATDAP